MMAEALHLSERRTFSYHMEGGVEGLHERAGLRSSRTRVVAAEHALVDLLHVLARRVTVDRDLIPHHETFSATIQPPYSSTKG